jgi:hypothetical protein
MGKFAFCEHFMFDDTHVQNFLGKLRILVSFMGLLRFKLCKFGPCAHSVWLRSKDGKFSCLTARISVGGAQV